MFVLVMYDVPSGRTEKFRKLLARYLEHRQNSVFIGNLKESELIRLRKDLSDLMLPSDNLVEITSENRNNINVRTFSKKTEKGKVKMARDSSHKLDFGII